MRTAEKAFCSICLIILLFFFCAVVMRIFSWHLPGKNGGEFEQASASAEIDWPALYPFSDDATAQDSSSEQSESLAERVVNKIRSIEGSVESYTTNYLIGYQKITELSKSYEESMRWNYVAYSEYNGIVETSDGYLTSLKPKEATQRCSDAVTSFSNYCDKKGIEFMYVNAPAKVCAVTDTDISGVTDFSNQNADIFLDTLNSNGIDRLDLREQLHNQGYDHHSLFYKTDHHWLPETGLWASGEIASFLKSEYGSDIDLSKLDPDQYTAEVYPKWFLGSEGKKVTLAVAEPEDFKMLYPEFETLIHYEVKSKDIESDGDFSITYDMGCVTVKDYYNKNPYAAYIHADQPLEKIENKMVDNDYHVLIVHDSFGNCVVPFLAMGIHKVDSIDLRYFNGSLHTYIEKEKPDAVIVMYPSGALGEKTAATDAGTIGDVFDFR